MKRRFDDEFKAVALVINSPGGSPVQSALIADCIRRLADEKKIPVYTFIEDIGASGGYWLACAGDSIYAHENSIVGSIGVIAASFGFEDLIARYGVERRVHSAGKNKSFWDPFLPEDPQDVEKLKKLQAEIHESFKNWVRLRRSGKLPADESHLFEGDFWTGKHALELGLIDALGDYHGVLREKHGTEAKFILIEEPEGFIASLLGLTQGGIMSRLLGLRTRAPISLRM